MPSFRIFVLLEKMNFVATSIYLKARRLALKEGLNPLLLNKHLQHEALQNGEEYLPINLLFELYEAADIHLYPGFSVRQGKQLQSQDYGTLGMAWRTCWQAQDVLACTARFMVLVTDNGSAKWQVNESESVLSLQRIATGRGAEMSIESAMVMLVNVLREVCATEINPWQVQFKHKANEKASLEDFFQTSVQFLANSNSLIFRSQDLRIATTKADQQLQSYLLKRLKEEEESIAVQADFLLKNIKSLIQESLPSGIPSLIQVAEHVNLSPRTLKRRLAEKSLSFRKMVQETQAETAIELVKHTQKSMGEITFLTGFSEASTFNRAFKRWTGKSPSNYRLSNK